MAKGQKRPNKEARKPKAGGSKKLAALKPDSRTGLLAKV
jgi:hypothetical protein